MYNFGNFLSEKAYEEIKKLQKPITISQIQDRLLQEWFSKSEISSALYMLIQLEVIGEKDGEIIIYKDNVLLYHSRDRIPKKFEVSCKVIKIDIDYGKELEQILSSWNKTFNVNQRYTTTLVWVYKLIRNKYSPEEIIYWIKKYIIYKKQNTWYTHTFSLYDFFKQKNGFEKYFNS